MTRMKAIVNARIVHRGEILDDHVLLFGENILRLSKEPPPADVRVIDAQGYYLSAGFVDLHIHGSGGADVMDATPEALETISRTLLQTGTTSFVATTMTMRREQIIAAIETVQAYGSGVSGAKVEGVHLEGPFINPLRCGAQDAGLIESPRLDWLLPYLQEIRMITLAPEMPGAEAFIKEVRALAPHLVMSIGHSDATYDEACESFAWGISHATHLYNAMPAWRHRAPGVVGAVLQSAITTDVIADLVHADTHALWLLAQCKPGKVALITDAMRAGCLHEGYYDLGGQPVKVANAQARLPSGVLAGSVLRLNEAVGHWRDATKATLAQAVACVTEVPAGILGLQRGALMEGYPADLVLFDEQMTIHQVYLNGEIKYTIT
jgi:N-acetylglucosamine-6-phosphate deacetylase